MPNWCSNTLRVWGDPVQLADFRVKSKPVEDGELSFAGTFPTPSEEEKNWYSWCCLNWGTKWDACESMVTELEEDSITYVFDSAWTPPSAWLSHIAPQFPLLRFELTYRESGVGFAGRTYAHGEVFDDESGDGEWIDEEGRVVLWDDEKRLWMVAETGEALEEGEEPVDFINPFEES